MKMINVLVNGEQFRVMEEVFGQCPKCQADTFGENENVYGDDPYAMEVCPTCGYWANTVMNSDDMEDDEEIDIKELDTQEERTAVDKFQDSFAMLYATMYEGMYGLKLDLDAEQIPVDEFLLRESFYKTCFKFGAVTKSFSTDEEYRSDRVVVRNTNMLAVIPEGKDTMGVFDMTFCDVEEL